MYCMRITGGPQGEQQCIHKCSLHRIARLNYWLAIGISLCSSFVNARVAESASHKSRNCFPQERFLDDLLYSFGALDVLLQGKLSLI